MTSDGVARISIALRLYLALTRAFPREFWHRIRMALGARRADVPSLVMKEGAALMVVGSVIGFAAGHDATARARRNELPKSKQSRNRLEMKLFILHINCLFAMYNRNN